MTKREKQLVRETFSEIREVAGPLSLLFYGRLFAMDPSLRQLFPGDMKQQGAKLMEMIAAVVASIDEWAALEATLREMGKRHAGYGVEDHHYDLVEQAMVWSIGQALGGGSSPEVKAAWGAVIREAGSAMRAGAA
jgi:hemoglobin-like flavoprotein